jgi:hypothetical protein
MAREVLKPFLGSGYLSRLLAEVHLRLGWLLLLLLLLLVLLLLVLLLLLLLLLVLLLLVLLMLLPGCAGAPVCH